MQYDKNGRLTRHGAEEVIRAGGSVTIKGSIYTSIDKLPSEAEFAKGDKDAESAARKSLEEQRAALDKQLASLPDDKRK